MLRCRPSQSEKHNCHSTNPRTWQSSSLCNFTKANLKSQSIIPNPLAFSSFAPQHDVQICVPIRITGAFYIENHDALITHWYIDNEKKHLSADPRIIYQLVTIPCFLLYSLQLTECRAPISDLPIFSIVDIKSIAKVSLSRYHMIFHEHQIQTVSDENRAHLPAYAIIIYQLNSTPISVANRQCIPPTRFACACPHQRIDVPCPCRSLCWDSTLDNVMAIKITSKQACHSFAPYTY